jgi:hypothetical protein
MSGCGPERDLRPGLLSRRYWRISGLIAEIAKPTLPNPDIGAKGAGPAARGLHCRSRGRNDKSQFSDLFC